LTDPERRSLRPGPATHRLRRGRFVTPYTSKAGASFGPLLRWKLSPNPKREAKRNDPFTLEVRPLPSLPPLDRDCLVWLGHASFLIQVAGFTLLTDPCLTAPPMMRRLAALPLAIGALAVDYLLISHGHYDHLDLRTLAALPGAPTALVPLRLGPLVQAGNPAIRVQEAAWYQVYDTPEPLRVTLLPALHWHRRTLADYNRSLWGSFHLQWPGGSLYFAGDTGYHQHFQEIADIVGPVDVALLPIGAYDPAFIMQQSHLNPEEALRAFADLRATRLVPMHFGTFDLTDEPLGEPLARLRAGSAKAGLEGRTGALAVGEVLFLD
jgi:L-ascorbate metabolism protein UlaG (beta-lactamase superfamily)